MSKVTNYTEKVEEVLEEEPDARDCDYKLYFHLINKINTNPTDHMLEMSLMDALYCMHKKTIPPIHSISRARRLVQEKYADIPSKQYLCGNRRKKKSLSEELSEEIINYKIENGNGNNTTE